MTGRTTSEMRIFFPKLDVYCSGHVGAGGMCALNARIAILSPYWKNRSHISDFSHICVFSHICDLNQIFDFTVTVQSFKIFNNLSFVLIFRELAIREELIRQEKLEQLAARFNRKASMRETWLSENQRLVSQVCHHI